MDRYVAQNVEKGSSLILAQHGGSYFQTKFHFHQYMKQKFLINIYHGKNKKKNIFWVLSRISAMLQKSQIKYY